MRSGIVLLAARWAGVVAQATVLGLLLALAVVALSSWAGGLRAFRYEAF